MREYPNQMKISGDLAELLDFSEIYCSAACCGLQAFEIHKSLLLRKIIDKGEKGISWYNALKAELEELYLTVEATKVDSEEEVPVIYPRNKSLPEYWLPHNELLHFLRRWNRVIKQVKGTNAVP